MVPLLHRRLTAVLVLGLGVAQALDSGIRHTPPVIIAVVLLALAGAAVAYWFSARPRTHFVAGALTMATMVVARMLSPVPLPTLALAGWFPLVAGFFLANIAKRSEMTN